MTDSRRRLTVVSGTILALALAGTAVASAHGRGRDDDRGMFGPGFGPDLGRGGVMRQWMADHMGLGLGLDIDSLVRREVTLDLGDQGIVVHRQDRGTATVASEASLSYTLATGERASVTTDEDTRIVALAQVDVADDQARRFRGLRMSADEIDLADVTAGSEVVVVAESGEDGSFLATRIVVLPAAATDEGGTTDSGAATTEDVEASPAPAA